MSLLPLKLTSPQLSFVSFDCTRNLLRIETQPTLNLPIIPSLMKLQDVQFNITAVLTRIPSTLEIEAKGTWVLGPLSFRVSVAYYRSTGETTINVITKAVSIDQIVKKLTGLTLPGSPQTIPSFTFYGYLKSGGSSTLILSSDKTKSNKFFAFYRQNKGQSAPVKAIAVDIKTLKLSSIIKSTIRIDISKVPFFGKIALKNIGLTLSSGDITNLPKHIFANTHLLKRNGFTIQKGLKIYAILPFMKKPVTITYTNKVLKISANSKQLGIKPLLKYIGSKFHLGKLKLPKQFDAIFSLYVQDITVTKTRAGITVVFPKPVTFFKGVLAFSDVIIIMYISSKKPKLSVKVTGNVILADAKFKTSLVQDKWQKYTLTAKGDNLNIHKVFVKFSAAVLPPIVSSFLKNIPFLHFSIQKPTIVYKIGSNPLHLRLGGTPIIHGFKTQHFDALITRKDGKVAVIMGFELNKVNVADILKKLTKFNFQKFALLNQDLSITTSVAPKEFQKLRFTQGGLKGVPINKGVSVTATMSFPSTCEKDKLCQLTSKLIGKDASFSIQATIPSATYFPITASVSNLRLSSKMVLTKAELRVIGGTNPSVGVIGVITLKKPKIVLSASVSISTKGFSLGLSMGGCWMNVFNAKWLSICNLLGSISFAPPTGVSGFELGGEVRLGYKSTGHQITAKGYAGFNLISPQDNYYYVSFTKATVGSVLKAFKIKARIPKPLADSGFPKGFLSSFSLSGKELPKVDVSIPAGFRFKGTLNILGLQGMVDVNIDLPRAVTFKVGLPPITIGSILKMYASPKNRKIGPYLNAVVRMLPRPYINIEAKGYVSFIGIKLETSLKITNSEYKFFIKGSVWGLFQASLLVHARYGNIKTASFRIKGEFKTDLFERIQKTVVNTLNSSAKKATAAINKAKGKLERAKVPFNRAIGKLNRAQAKVNQAKLKIKRAGDKVAATRRRLMSKCKIRKCKKCKLNFNYFLLAAVVILTDVSYYNIKQE